MNGLEQERRAMGEDAYWEASAIAQEVGARWFSYDIGERSVVFRLSSYDVPVTLDAVRDDPAKVRAYLKQRKSTIKVLDKATAPATRLGSAFVLLGKGGAK